MIVARRDERLLATVVSSRPLFYCGGPDSALDRPAHVRASSSLAWAGERLCLVQDDANFLALVDPQGLAICSLALPAGHEGRRQFDDLRGTKAWKLDLEACVAYGDGKWLVAFGSGSTANRETAALIDLQGDSPVLLRHAPELYAMLRQCVDFCGPCLNIEGAVVMRENRIRFFQRGNGRGPEACNATAELDWPALERYLRDPNAVLTAELSDVRRYDLGSIEGLPLTFTDAAVVGGCLCYCASAEDSPDAIQDGRVAGSAIGVIEDRDVRWTELRLPDGSPFLGKIEGICERQDAANRLFAVVDGDDPQRPSELCVIELSGDWPMA